VSADIVAIALYVLGDDGETFREVVSPLGVEFASAARTLGDAYEYWTQHASDGCVLYGAKMDGIESFLRRRL
jgi:hypothetical protein